MTVVYSEEHEAFRRSLRAFLSKEVTPHYRAWEQNHRPDREFWRKAGAQGFLGMALPEEYGGVGGDFLFHIIVSQELGACPGAESCGGLLQSDMNCFHIFNFGTEEQREYWLPRMTSGDALMSIAMTEPHSGSDLAGIRTSAIRDGDDYVINGSKIYISLGAIADAAIVAVKTTPSLGAKGVSLLIVDLDAPGLTRGKPLAKMGMQGSDTVELFFEDVRVPASSILGAEGQGFGILMSELPRERLLVPVRALEAAQRAFDMTVEFTKSRKAFGKAIIEYQNTQFVLAGLKTELAAARAFTDRCIEDAAQGTLSNVDSAMLKLHVTELQGRVMDSCVQLHGGAGYMDEYEISKLYTAARVTRIFGGTSEIMKYTIARTL